MRRRTWQNGFTIIEAVLGSAVAAAVLAPPFWALGLG
jgi:hypothetical protein